MTSLVLTILMLISVSTDIQEETVESLGEYRITEYCPACNDPCGHESASGEHLEEGHVAMNDVPLGTEIELDGKRYTVVDRCGIENTVDVFVESNECNCMRLERKEIRIIHKKGEMK